MSSLCTLRWSVQMSLNHGPVERSDGTGLRSGGTFSRWEPAFNWLETVLKLCARKCAPNAIPSTTFRWHWTVFRFSVPPRWTTFQWTIAVYVRTLTSHFKRFCWRRSRCFGGTGRLKWPFSRSPKMVLQPRSRSQFLCALYHLFL